MPRPLRMPLFDGCYHVFGRGIERRPIVEDNRDREHFVELLAAMKESYRKSK